MRSIRLIVVMSALLMAAEASGASAMSREEFLALLEAFQAKTTSVEIEAYAREYATDRKTGVRTERPSFVKSHTILDGAAGGRVLFEADICLPSGKSFRQVNKAFAYNGKVTTYVQRDASGKSRSSQTIEADRKGFVKTFAPLTGIDVLPAYYDDTGLAQFLRKKGDKWQLDQRGDGRVAIRYPREDDAEDKCVCEIILALNRGGAITGTKLFGSSGALIGEVNFFDLRDNGAGVWLPVSAERKDYESRTDWQISFTSFKVNETHPDDTFIVKFESGTQVWDKIANKRFVAGHDTDKALLQEISQSLENFRSEAAPETTFPTGPAPQPGSAPADGERTGRRSFVLGFLVAIGIVVVVVVAVGLFRKARAKRLPLVLVATLLFCSDMSAATLPEGIERTGYKADYYGVSIPVFQCGVYCAAVQLTYWQSEANLSALRTHLACDDRGTDLLRLKEVLDAYGLDVAGAKGLTVRQLRRSVEEGKTAVIATRIKSEIPHFLSVVGYDSKGFATIDCPKGLHTIAEQEMAELLHSGDGMALLVRRASAPRETAGEFALRPGSIDFGDLSEKQEEQSFEFVVENTSPRMANIKLIRAPCGCVRLKPSATWIAPGQSITVAGAILPQSWGAGDRKNVYVHFANGASNVFVIRAKGRPPGAVDISAVPALVCENQQSFGEALEVVRTVRLTHKRAKPLTVALVRSDVEWVSVEAPPSEQPASESTLVLRIKKLTQPGTHEATVTVTCQGIADPVLVAVRQEFRPPFRVNPPVVEFQIPDGAPQVVEVAADDAADPCSIQSVDSPNGYITAQCRESAPAQTVAITLALDPTVCSVINTWTLEKLAVHVRQGSKDCILSIPVILRPACDPAIARQESPAE